MNTTLTVQQEFLQWQRHQSLIEEVARSRRMGNPERYYYWHLSKLSLREPWSPWYRFRRSSAYTLFMLTHASAIQAIIAAEPRQWKNTCALDR